MNIIVTDSYAVTVTLPRVRQLNVNYDSYGSYAILHTSLKIASVTSSQVILNGPKDWDDWLEIIRTTAIGADIWSLINPNVGTPEVLI